MRTDERECALCGERREGRLVYSLALERYICHRCIGVIFFEFGDRGGEIK